MTEENTLDHEDKGPRPQRTYFWVARPGGAQAWCTVVEDDSGQQHYLPVATVIPQPDGSACVVYARYISPDRAEVVQNAPGMNPLYVAPNGEVYAMQTVPHQHYDLSLIAVMSEFPNPVEALDHQAEIAGWAGLKAAEKEKRSRDDARAAFAKEDEATFRQQVLGGQQPAAPPQTYAHLEFFKRIEGNTDET